MKFPTFDHAKGYRKFDRFGEFYNELDTGIWWGYNATPFILLETGEFMVTQARFKPERRKFNERLNCEIIASSEFGRTERTRGKSLVTPDGDDIKFAWLNQNCYQSLWIDHDHARVVRLRYHYNGKDKDRSLIPPRLRTHATLYYAGQYELPVGGGAIDVSQPDKWTKEEKEHIDQMRAACRAWNMLTDEAVPPQGAEHFFAYNYDRATGAHKPNPYYIPREPMKIDALMKLQYADMTWSDKKQLVMRGVQPRRKVTEVPYLNIV